MKHSNDLSDSVWVIVPVFNEELYIERFLKKLVQHTTNIIIVDDGSRDSTLNKCQSYTRHCLSHTINLGKGAALKTGLEYAFTQLDAKAVVFMDGDDQHDVVDLRKFDTALKNHDVVFGVRALDAEMPLFRRFGNKCVSLLVQIFFGTYVPDILCGYNALTKKGYQAIHLYAHSYDIELELTVKTIREQLRYTTVPVRTVYHELDRGMTLLDALRILVMLVIWRISP